jgi:hypothetical protein
MVKVSHGEERVISAKKVPSGGKRHFNKGPIKVKEEFSVNIRVKEAFQ